MGLLENVKKLLFESEETEETFVDVKTEDGRIMRVDDIAEGMPVMEVTEEGVVEVEDGNYVIVDAEGVPTAEIVVEGGVITSVMNKSEEEAEDEVSEEEMSEESEEESKEEDKEEVKEELEEEEQIDPLKEITDSITALAKKVAELSKGQEAFAKEVEAFKKAPSEEHTKTKKEFSLTDSNKKGKKSSPIFYAGK